MSHDVTVEVDLPYPPKDVWFALTDPGALAEWLMPVDGFAPEVGTKFTLRAKPMPGWDGVVHCEVSEVDEPSRLAYTWRGSRMRTTTTVTWELTERSDGGTRLRLDHKGFSGLAGAVLAFMHRGGWKKMVRTRLLDRLRRTEVEGTA
jgi:uncharacterized protein YndB with AHSA1/START domain